MIFNIDKYYTCKECEDEVYIGEAIKTTYDIIQWAKNNNKVGIISLMDFEKAYDSLSFSYIKKKCLHFLNLGNSIIGWVESLLHNFSAVINHCGNISRKFSIGRGARQGDPIASYLFIICIEILVLIHLSKVQLSKDHFVQGTLVKEEFFPKRYRSKETIVQSESFKP